MAFRDESRWYTINPPGVTLPSVTTALGIVDKPGLVYWSANEERAVFQDALIAVLARKEKLTRSQILDAVIAASSGVKAHRKTMNEARAIGTAAHALIEWHTRKMLGEKVGDEPKDVPAKAIWAVESWKDWCRDVNFAPLYVERQVHCLECGYAGTADWIAKVKGVVALGDVKTSKAVYEINHLQIQAYRHAARKQGIETEQGIILRLPKTVDDPAFEAVFAVETPQEDFLAALRLWHWKRRMDGYASTLRKAARDAAKAEKVMA